MPRSPSTKTCKCKFDVIFGCESIPQRQSVREWTPTVTARGSSKLSPGPLSSLRGTYVYLKHCKLKHRRILQVLVGQRGACKEHRSIGCSVARQPFERRGLLEHGLIGTSGKESKYFKATGSPVNKDMQPNFGQNEREREMRRLVCMATARFLQDADALPPAQDGPNPPRKPHLPPVEPLP